MQTLNEDKIMVSVEVAECAFEARHQRGRNATGVRGKFASVNAGGLFCTYTRTTNHATKGAPITPAKSIITECSP